MTRLIRATAALALLLIASSVEAQTFQIRATRQPSRGVVIQIGVTRGLQPQRTGFVPGVVHPGHPHRGVIYPIRHPGIDSYPIKQYTTCPPVYPYAPAVVPYSTGHPNGIRRIQRADGTFVIIN